MAPNQPLLSTGVDSTSSERSTELDASCDTRGSATIAGAARRAAGDRRRAGATTRRAGAVKAWLAATRASARRAMGTSVGAARVRERQSATAGRTSASSITTSAARPGLEQGLLCGRRPLQRSDIAGPGQDSATPGPSLDRPRTPRPRGASADVGINCGEIADGGSHRVGSGAPIMPPGEADRHRLRPHRLCATTIGTNKARAQPRPRLTSLFLPQGACVVLLHRHRLRRAERQRQRRRSPFRRAAKGLTTHRR